jgi:hypothetical protein
VFYSSALRLSLSVSLSLEQLESAGSASELSDELVDPDPEARRRLYPEEVDAEALGAAAVETSESEEVHSVSPVDSAKEGSALFPVESDI